MSKKYQSMDGNAAAAYSAHAMNEVIAIYPITPSSPMGAISDKYSAGNRKNIFGQVPTVSELQSEGGASGAVHGSLSAGCLTTTFTASQGLLLMIPNMYKIAGELLPSVFHIAARSVSTQALSIFGDHQDVMACRETGWATVASANQQEVMDLAAITQAASIKSQIPFLHFFDGFRTSHEIKKVELLDYEVMKSLVDMDMVKKFRERALNPDSPIMKGTAQNPDIYFQSREIQNPYYDATAGIFEEKCKKFAQETGRQYTGFKYFGHPEAETVIAIMGSAADVTEEAIEYMANNGEKVGYIRVYLYRPFDIKSFANALPQTAKKVLALDRTKEPGAPGEPLYLDIVSALNQAKTKGLIDSVPFVSGGRYGLSSKEFTPAMVIGAANYIKDTAESDIQHGLTIGINDDVTHLSIDHKPIDTENESVYRAKFYGLGSDGTVGANKNSIKVIGDHTDKYVQGYFVYDSKKSGGVTVSHLRFSDKPILSSYLISNPDFVAIHNQEFIGRYNMLEGIKEGGTVLINTQVPAEKIFAKFPERDQKIIIDNKLKVYCIDAYEVAGKLGLGGRINTVMQAAFFKIADIMPEDQFSEYIESAIKKTYSSKGSDIVESNIKAFQAGKSEFKDVPVPAAPVGDADSMKAISLEPTAEDEEHRSMLKDVIEPIIHNEGDSIPVSKVPEDGTFPTGLSKYEKRNIAIQLPEWDKSLCVQCGFCSFACPHAAILAKISDKNDIKLSDDEYPTVKVKGIKAAGENDVWRIQVAPEDCTGCGVCQNICIGKDKATGKKALEMVPKQKNFDTLKKSYEEFLRLPDTKKELVNDKTVKGSQLNKALFEFSGACAGCGETPYVKLMTQLSGENTIHANATGCSSIYGGTAPVSPFTKNKDGQGPAWASSLFEDNAEYGYGMRLAVNQLNSLAFSIKDELVNSGSVSDEVKSLLSDIPSIAEQKVDKAAYQKANQIVKQLKPKFENAAAGSLEAQMKDHLSYLKNKVVWIVGGDGWAYDIGFGGLDHVVASGEDVNILVMDTEVYSNTGGQRSKATPMGGIAQFAASGKETFKKDLGQMCMSYQNVYVASVNFGANPNQTLKAFNEALSYPGVSIIIAYSNCIAHGINMTIGPDISKLADQSGYWLLYRYDPRLLDQNKNPLQLDTKAIKGELNDYLKKERRFKTLMEKYPDTAKDLLGKLEKFIANRYNYYKLMSEMNYDYFQTY